MSHDHNPINYDVNIIKKILKQEDMNLLVNDDDLMTIDYICPLVKEPDNLSYGSNDTRCMLGKRKINICKFLEKINAKLHYICSGTYGHIFRGDIKKDDNIIYQFALKVAAYPKRSIYGDINNLSRPENSEIMMLRVLSYFVNTNQTPHLLLPITTFYTDINFFLLLPKYDFIKHNKNKYDDFVACHKAGKYENIVSVLITEWANRGDFLDFVKKNYKNFKLIHWQVFFFQLISVLAIIQSKYPNFRHNDLKANNVLIQKIKEGGKFCAYTICNKKYIVKNIGYQLKLWDFDFACIKGIVDNIKATEEWSREKANITNEKNRYYDVHYFFNTLIRFVPEIYKDEKHVPREVSQFIDRIIPAKYKHDKTRISTKGRLLVDDEFITPKTILENDDFFSVFRFQNE